MGIQRDREIGQEGLCSKTGVFEETAHLRRVMMWGRPGPEAIIAQILPEDISCFLEDFSVVGARKEFDNALGMIKAEGTEVTLVKDLYAKMIDDLKIEPKHTRQELKDALLNKALEFSKQYPNGNTKELELIEEMVDEECKVYGERAAIVMNERLSLANRLPLANVLYARDQSNVAGKSWIWSSMRREIRQPEVALFKEILTYSKLVTPENFEHIVEVSGTGRFEGGDGIANAGFYFIGIGGRTNLEGIKQVAPAVLSQGLRLVVFRDAERDKGRENEMKAMHLDTIWMPSDKDRIVACGTQVDRRVAFELSFDKDQGIQISRAQPMAKFMESLGMQIIPLSEAEQEAFAPNFLNMGNGTVILSIGGEKAIDRSKGEESVEEKLVKQGKIVKNANLENITKGYGGLHCMTAALLREE